MLIRKEKYHDDISAAYTRGLEQGFELARRLKRNRNAKRRENSSLLEVNRLEESPLLLQQLVDIASRKGITLK